MVFEVSYLHIWIGDEKDRVLVRDMPVFKPFGSWRCVLDLSRRYIEREN